jgi:hypothetical protein
MTIHLTIDLRAVILGVVLLLVAAGIATPFAASLADDGDERSVAQAANAPVTTAFTYQGRLDTNGAPANGVYDFNFSLFDDGVVGAPDTQIGATQIVDNVGVANGLFTVTLDFGSSPFTGSGRWLSVEAKADAEPGYALMSPRQPMSPVPYALYSSKTGPHDHFGETWTGSALTGLTVLSTYFGIVTSGEPTALIATQGALAPPTTRHAAIHAYSVGQWGIVAEGSIGALTLGSNVGLDAFGTNIGIQAQGNVYAGKFIGAVDVAANGATALNVNNSSTVGNSVALYGTATGPFGTGLVGQNLVGGEGVVGVGVVDGTQSLPNRRGIGVVGRSYVFGSSPPFQDAAYSGSGVYGEGKTGVSALGTDRGVQAAGLTGVRAEGREYGVVSFGGENANGTPTGFAGGGVYGLGHGRGAPAAGVNGYSSSNVSTQPGDCDTNTNAILSDYCIGVYGEAIGTASIGVAGRGFRIGVYGQASVGTGFAGFFRGDLVAEGTCYCTLSDGRMKRDVADLNYGLADVMALRPVGFAWKNEEQDGGKRHAGFIAQEAETVAPELVLNPSGDTLYVDPMAFTALLVKAVQEQQAQVEEQEARIAALEAKTLTPNPSPGFAGEGGTGGGSGAGDAAAIAPQVTVIRQSFGPSNGVLMALAIASVLLALTVLSHGRMSRGHTHSA